MHDDNWPAFAGGLLLASLLTLIVAGAFGCARLKDAHDRALQAMRAAEDERDRARGAEARARQALGAAEAAARKEREGRRKAEAALQQYTRETGPAERAGQGTGTTHTMDGV
jgi:hypothetical protein